MTCKVCQRIYDGQQSFNLRLEYVCGLCIL